MHYTGPVVRPPHEIGSELLEVTVGCTHNSCRFCNFYEGARFRMAPMEQIQADVAELAVRNPGAERVWALGGDTFTLPMSKLEPVAAAIHEACPNAQIPMYARVDSLRNKSAADVAHLHELGVNDLVIGIESGDDEILAMANKGYDSAELVEALSKLDEGGMDYRVIYLSGLAGHGRWERNVERTAEALSHVRPWFMYITAVTFFPGTAMYDDIRAGKFVEQTELEKIRENRALIAALENDIVVSTQTSANLLNLTVKLPRDRERALEALDGIIENYTDEDERRLRRMRDMMLSA